MLKIQKDVRARQNTFPTLLLNVGSNNYDSLTRILEHQNFTQLKKKYIFTYLLMPIRKDGQLIEILHLTNGRRYHNHSNSKFVPEYFEVNHFEAKYFEPEIKEKNSFRT